jgi:hypothetical protein
MAITNYSELKIAVIEWSKRDDIDQKVDDFIALAESFMLSNPTESLRLREQEVRSTANTVASDRYLQLPTDFISMRKLTVIDDTTRYQLRYETPSQLNVKDYEGVPQSFTVTSQLEFDRAPDQVYVVEMQYMSEFYPLTPANTTNIVLTESPNIYLFGCLAMAARYAQDIEEEGRYLPLFFDAISGLNRKVRDGRYGPRPKMIPRGMKP